MEYDPKDSDVIQLLQKLKDANGSYPQEMLALRRQGYLGQVAEISAGASLAMALKNIAKSGGNAGGVSSATGMIVEALLVVALVAEAGAVTYFYRDKIAQYFLSVTNSNAPHVQEVSNPPIMSSPVPEIELTPSPLMMETDTLTPFVMPSLDVTPSLELASEPTNPNVRSNGSNNQSASTQVHAVSTQAPQSPNVNNKGNNGNHYGQTPKPERTKENGYNPQPKDQGNSTESPGQSTVSKKKKP